MPDPAKNLREDFLREIRRRFRRLRGQVRRWAGYEDDIFGLGQDAQAATSAADLPDDAPQVFRFQTDRAKIAAFLAWWQDRLDADFLEPMPQRRVRNGEHWTGALLRAAYAQAWLQARSRLRTESVSVGSLPGGEGGDVIEGLLDMPAPSRALETLYTRTYENLQSIGADAAEPVRDTLVEGMENGWNPRKTADKLTKEVRTLQHTRAETLARSETQHAYSVATLDRYERAGVGVVSHGEWLDTNDARVCTFCRRLSGAELTLAEMRDGLVEFRGQVYRLTPPSHANGRCSIAPSVDSEPPTSPLSERVPGTVLAGG